MTMRKAYITLISATLLAFSATDARAEGPKARWLNPVFNFGAFSEDLGTVTCQFKAVNDGDEALTIWQARANCGCTTPRYTNNPVAPGDTLTINVGYNSIGRPGLFDKKVYIRTSDGKEQTLTITGTVLGASNTLKGRYPVQIGSTYFDRDIMAFGEAKGSHIAHSSIKGYNNSPDTIHPSTLNLPSYIDVKFSPEAVPPGEQFVVSAGVDAMRCGDYGLVTDSITLVIDHDPAVLIPISTVAIVNEDFSHMTPEQLAKAPKAKFSEPNVDFGRLPFTSDPVTKTFEITNTGKSKLLLRKVYTPESYITLKVDKWEVKPGKSTKIHVTLDPSKCGPGPVINSRLTVIVNEPEYPQTIMRLTGELY